MSEARTRSLIILIVLLGLLVAAFLGNFHVITGGTVGLKVVPRNAIGFAEPFINIDEITGMPWIAAKIRYPLGCRVLQERGIIESDDEMRERMRRTYAPDQ